MTLAVIIDTDASSRRRLTRLLEGEGLSVLEASSGAEALQLTFDAKPDVAVVGFGISIGSSGLIQILRAACPIPIVALVDGGDPTQVVEALDSGADDAIPRTCESVEFVARMRVAVRRHEDPATGRDASTARVIRTGSLTIDRDARMVRKHGAPIPLSRTEYLMVDALSSHLGEVAPHRYLLREVWGEAFVDEVQYLRVYIGYLRQKIEDDPGAPQYFVNDWGVGYRLARLPIEIAARNQPPRRAQLVAVATA